MCSKLIIKENDKIALIGFNKFPDLIEEDIVSCKKREHLSIYSSWLIQEEFENIYREKKPFNLYINTGNKNLEYVYTVEDFVTKRGSEGIKCPEKWLKYIETESYFYPILKKYDFKVYPQYTSLPIKTWFLISRVEKVDSKIEWSKIQDIRGIPARSSGKSYYLYVIDPLQGKGN